MKKLILFILFFAQSIVAQTEPKVFTEYNNCEIYPQLLSKKDVVKEIVKQLNVEETVDIHFYISKQGNFFSVNITNKEKYYSKLHRILDNLGKWFPGEVNGEKVVVRIKFRIKYESEGDF